MTVLDFVKELCKRFFNGVINIITSLWSKYLEKKLLSIKPWFYPEIGWTLYLAKGNERLPYIVIDIKDYKVAIQSCFIEDGKLFHDLKGEIVLLSWSKCYGWHWKRSIYDTDPEIALFMEK